MKTNTPTCLFPEGASPDALRALQVEVGSLPNPYLELLRLGNGGEVGLSVHPLLFCLDPVESALDYWRSGTYTMKGIFVFGSNGGGEYLAFDLRTPGKWPVVSFDPIDPEGSIRQVAADFESFLSLVKEDEA